MSQLFPDSTIDYNTPVMSVISDSRASVNSGIFKNRTKNQVKATECVLWSNRGDEVTKVVAPVEPIGNVTEMIASEASKKNKRIKKATSKNKKVSSSSTDEGGDVNQSNISTENQATPEVQDDIVQSFVPCSCHPAEQCAMKTIDSSTSLHKCFKCSAKIFAICAPQFEDTLEVLCRHCVSTKAIEKTAITRKAGKLKRKRQSKDDKLSSDEDVFISRADCSKVSSRRTGTRRLMSRSAALSSTTKNADILKGAKDYHDDPELLFQSHVHRFGKKEGKSLAIFFLK